ncbi:MAG TPA: hypothetical protein VF861_07600 [Telluria sp.]
MPQLRRPPADPSLRLDAAQHQSEALDEALAESFPASDSVAVSISRIDPPERPARHLPDIRTRDNIVL